MSGFRLEEGRRPYDPASDLQFAEAVAEARRTFPDVPLVFQVQGDELVVSGFALEFDGPMFGRPGGSARRSRRRSRMWRP